MLDICGKIQYFIKIDLLFFFNGYQNILNYIYNLLLAHIIFLLGSSAKDFPYFAFCWLWSALPFSVFYILWHQPRLKEMIFFSPHLTFCSLLKKMLLCHVLWYANNLEPPMISLRLLKQGPVLPVVLFRHIFNKFSAEHNTQHSHQALPSISVAYYKILQMQNVTFLY